MLYAGYEKAPDWLSTAEVLGRVQGDREGYRREAEGRLSQGRQEGFWSNLKWGVVLGSEKFAEKMRKAASVVRETQGRGALRKEVNWTDVVKVVERIKGESWGDFANRYGDWGRDLALWIARRRGGMTLKELGHCAGGMDYSAVSEAIRTFERVRLKTAEVRLAHQRACQYLNLET